MCVFVFLRKLQSFYQILQRGYEPIKAIRATENCFIVFKVLLHAFLFDPLNISEGDMAGSLSHSACLPPSLSLSVKEHDWRLKWFLRFICRLREPLKVLSEEVI